MTRPTTELTALEAGSPADDSRAFRRCLGQFATGVTVMTACHGEQLAGMSVNSFAALSLEPPLVLWSIRRESGSLPVFQQAGHFAVNVLAADQVALSNRFASSSADKFAGVDWSAGQAGAPLLAGAIAHLECQLHQVVDGGDHLILVGRVEHYARFSGEPLLFTQGRYAVTQEHPEAERSAAAGAASASVPVPDATAQAVQGSLLRLLHYTSHQMSASFDAQRQAEGLSVAQFRTYGWLRLQPLTVEQLRQRAYLGGRDADDTVAGLLERGHLSRDAAGVLTLTAAGRERADTVARRVAAFEAEMLQGASDADRAATRRVLQALAERTAALSS